MKCNIKPTMEDRARLFDKMRMSKSAYEWFYDTVLSCVVGKQYWFKHCHEADGCSMANPGDEALALLLLDNSWNLWRQRAEKIQRKREEREDGIDSSSDDDDSDENIYDAEEKQGSAAGEPDNEEKEDDDPPPAAPKRRIKRRKKNKPKGEGRDYGTRYTTAKGGARMLGGWTVEGINAFTAFRARVVADRKQGGDKFDKWYRARKLRERKGKVLRLKGNVVDAGFDFPSNDWSDEEEEEEEDDIESDEDGVAKIVGDVTRHIAAADAAGAIMGLAAFTTATI